MLLSVSVSIPKTVFRLRRREWIQCGLVQEDAIFQLFFIPSCISAPGTLPGAFFSGSCRCWYQNGHQMGTPGVTNEATFSALFLSWAPGSHFGARGGAKVAKMCQNCAKKVPKRYPKGNFSAILLQVLAAPQRGRLENDMQEKCRR